MECSQNQKWSQVVLEDIEGLMESQFEFVAAPLPTNEFVRRPGARAG
jgi:hypothetical protein